MSDQFLILALSKLVSYKEGKKTQPVAESVKRKATKSLYSSTKVEEKVK